MSAAEPLSPDQFGPGPNVRHYRDGGMGGVGAEHSVVGMVPTEYLRTLREYDRAGADPNPNSRKVIDGIRSDIRSGKGITEPLQVEYNNKRQWGYLGEGNHRLQAAIEEGVSHVPVRVNRSYNGPKYRQERGVGGHIEHSPIPGVSPRDATEGYIPSDLHPKYLFGENNERAPLSADQFKDHQVNDIMGLLGPR